MFTLPPLGYEFAALEPTIDAQTMEIHYTKHHQAYIDKLNAALQPFPELQNKNVEELLRNFNTLPEACQTAVKNHGGGHANHSLFWKILTPSVDSKVSAELQAALELKFGGVDALKESLATQAAAQFGSGWGWLVLKSDKTLAVVTTANQDSPLMQGDTPLLGIDVWEHAYYLKYQNRRPEYLTAVLNALNWSVISELYAEALK